MPRPRIIKSHQYFHPNYKRVIYVVRDPRDVALSQFHFHRKRKLIEDDYPIEKFVTRFVAGQTGPYGSWGDNVASWLSTRHNRPGFLLLRYEDMLEDAARELGKGRGVPGDSARSWANPERREAQFGRGDAKVGKISGAPVVFDEGDAPRRPLRALSESRRLAREYAGSARSRNWKQPGDI